LVYYHRLGDNILRKFFDTFLVVPSLVCSIGLIKLSIFSPYHMLYVKLSGNCSHVCM